MTAALIELNDEENHLVPSELDIKLKEVVFNKYQGFLRLSRKQQTHIMLVGKGGKGG